MMRKPVLLGTICLLLAAATAAQAATIVVTRRTDVVADDGRCSLREAVTAANTGLPSGTRAGECIGGDPLPVVDVIQLRRGGYKLALGGPGEDGNAGGDLDVFESVVIEGKGRGRTKIRNRVGDPAIIGDGDRLFHVDPAASGGVDVTFVGLTLAGGDVACTGQGCVMGASAVETTGNGAMTFERCRVLRNAASCYGSGCGNDQGTAAIRALGGGALAIRRSIIQRNRAVCEGTSCRSGSAAILMHAGDADEDFILEESTVKQNASTCSGPGCLTGAPVSVTARDIVVRSVELRKNEVACGGSECGGASMIELFADPTVTLEDVQVNGNTIDCEGDGCQVGVVLHCNGGEGIALQDVGADGNVTACAGTACSTREQLRLTSGTGAVTLDRVALVQSVIVCHGDGCRPAEMIDVFAAETITLRDSRIAEDGVACTGLACDNAGLVRLNAPAFQIERTAVTDNTLVCVGDGCEADRILSLQAGGDGVLTDTDVLRNVNQCVGDDCLAFAVLDAFSRDGSLDVTGGAASDNAIGCVGDRCEVRNVLKLLGDVGITLSGTALERNELHCQGAACRNDDLASLRSIAGSAAIIGTAIADNLSRCDGNGCAASPIVRIATHAAGVDASSFSANASECQGTPCSVGFGGALSNSSANLLVADSTFTDNRTDGFGAGIFNGAGNELQLEGVTMTGNAAGLRRTIEFGGLGGAIYNDADVDEPGSMLVRNSVIRLNLAQRGGGGILNEGEIELLEGSTIGANQPTNCTNLGGTGCP